MTYLTKSKFKEALSCPARLFYCNNHEYANQSLDDPFLSALADGGHQVGALALFLFSNDPYKEGIIVSGNNEQALETTTQRLFAQDRVVLAEAAFAFENLYIRSDIIVKEGDTINIYEVKAKSVLGEDEENEDEDVIQNKTSFYSFFGKYNECIKSKWAPYLYDLAFQKYVVSKAHPNFTVKSHLILANKKAKASIDGLNQMFQLVKDGNKTKIVVEKGITAEKLGDPVLSIVNLDEQVEKILNIYKVPTSLSSDYSFDNFLDLCKSRLERNTKIVCLLTSRCKACSYYNNTDNTTESKDGRKECWKEFAHLTDDELCQPFVTCLWNNRKIDPLIRGGKYLLKDIGEEDIKSKNYNPTVHFGLDDYERKLMQIQKVREGDNSYYFDKEGFKSEMAKWRWPLNLIDFETSAVALPFHKGTSPYQGIAFQFSHHILHENGTVEHANQFIHFEKNVYPNLEFIRALKNSLSVNDGSIFRYHNHENTYLRIIHKQITSGTLEMPPDETVEILDFIDNITQYKPDPKKDNEVIKGERNMIDLFDIIKRFYYPPSANGHIGLKYILPAIIKDSSYLREKYAKKGVYGKNLELKSLNFEDHQWIDPDYNNDPYRTLPNVFDQTHKVDSDQNKMILENIAQGGAALTAYNLLQYTNISDEDKLKYRDALLRYCELDTAAMVFLIEGLMHLEQRT